VVYQTLEKLAAHPEGSFPGPGTFQMSRKGNIHFESEAVKTDD
jgi:hypothetical protein